MIEKIDFYGEDLNVYRANFHTHSTNSDGQYPLSQVIKFYGENKYDILAVTDHHTTSRLSEIDSGDLLLINGMEFHPTGPRGIRLHLVALNIPEGFTDPSELPYWEAIDAVRKAGGECILAHPYWSGLNSSDLMGIENLMAIELFNTDTQYIGKGYSVQLWDNILQLGYHLPAVAVDDTHSPRDFFGGWTMVCAKEKSSEAVMDALRKGSFFASQGPVFHKLSFKNNIFSVECSPCEELLVISDCSFGICGSMPGFKAETLYDREKANEISSFKVEIPDAPTLSYVRCQIRDKNGKYAWSSPIKINE